VGKMRFLVVFLTLSLMMMVSWSVFAQEDGDSYEGLSFITDPNTQNAERQDNSGVPQFARYPNANEVPAGCVDYTFEGLLNVGEVPTFDGIRFPGWLSLIDRDEGGSGNFANEPSPSTIIFWLGGQNFVPSSRTIEFPSPVSYVSMFYASRDPVRLEAFDSLGNRIDSIRGGSNFQAGPSGDPTGAYNQWDLISVEDSSSRIASIRFSGVINGTGIDDIRVCRSTRVDSVEFTQAIQEY